MVSLTAWSWRHSDRMSTLQKLWWQQSPFPYLRRLPSYSSSNLHLYPSHPASLGSAYGKWDGLRGEKVSHDISLFVSYLSLSSPYPHSWLTFPTVPIIVSYRPEGMKGGDNRERDDDAHLSPILSSSPYLRAPPYGGEDRRRIGR